MYAVSRVGILFAFALAIEACGTPAIQIPGVSPSPTAPPAPSYTPVVSSPTSTTAPTQTAIVATPSPESTATATAMTSTPGAPEGMQVSFGNLSLVIPEGLAAGTTNSTGTGVEFPYINPSNGDMPQHVKIVLDGYPVQGTTLAPQVLVFPAADYAQYAPGTEPVITALQNLQFMDGQPLPDGFPDGPFNAHVGSVAFANGRGLRYLTQFDQAPLPVNNQELIYFFHGLTTDGKTYVEVILPLEASFLAPDSNPASSIPAGGIPFNMDDFSSYVKTVSDKLNATPPDEFTPSLGTLDALVQSIATK